MFDPSDGSKDSRGLEIEKMTATQTSSFQQVLASFKCKLDPCLVTEFEMTTVKDLKHAINGIQQKQASEKKIRNMRRLQRFLDAMQQYGQVIEVFLNVTDILAFVWGPMKLLLQVTSRFSDAFMKLLDTYELIGDSLPLLEKCQDSFLGNTPYVQQALVAIFRDILEFHESALRYFRKSVLKQILQATWSSYKAKIQPIIDDLTRHKQLLEGRVTFSQLELILSNGVKALEEFERQKMMNDMITLRAVHEWLGNINVNTDQETISRVRQDNPEAGCWLLQHELFRNWLNENEESNLLWLNGIPGAGKSVLSSIIVENCLKGVSSPTVWFYCRHQDQRRSTFIAFARALIAQLLTYNRDLLPYISENIDGPLLSSEKLAKELLEALLTDCGELSIILDGLDECAPVEERKIIGWLRSVIEPLNQLPNGSKGPRCVFVSQRDATSTKLLRDIPSLSITPTQNYNDILNYVAVCGLRLQDKFLLSEDDRDSIVALVAEKAEGMFLFVKLVMSTLLAQISRDRLSSEINETGLPKGLDAAYDRLLKVILRGTSPAQAKQLLIWLVCAKRPLRWRDVQGAVSINLNDEHVDFYGRQWMEDHKDLCGSFVEIRSDGTLELVHTTAKMYFIRSGFIDIGKEELNMASLCVGYLSLIGFEARLAEDSVQALVMEGYYGFIDYAACYWSAHLRVALTYELDQEIISLFMRLMGRFIKSHYRSPGYDITISSATRGLLEALEVDGPVPKSIIQVFSATEDQVQRYDDKASSNDTHDIPSVISRIRRVTEETASKTRESWDGMEQSIFDLFYASGIYKCSQMSCQNFHHGFETLEERERHVQKHSRPYLCTFPGCLRADIGFASHSELKRHLLSHNIESLTKKGSFPSRQRKLRLKCDDCLRAFTSPKEFSTHPCTPKPSYQSTIHGGPSSSLGAGEMGQNRVSPGLVSLDSGPMPLKTTAQSVQSRTISNTHFAGAQMNEPIPTTTGPGPTELWQQPGLPLPPLPMLPKPYNSSTSHPRASILKERNAIHPQGSYFPPARHIYPPSAWPGEVTSRTSQQAFLPVPSKGMEEGADFAAANAANDSTTEAGETSQTPTSSIPQTPHLTNLVSPDAIPDISEQAYDSRLLVNTNADGIPISIKPFPIRATVDPFETDQTSVLNRYMDLN